MSRFAFLQREWGAVSLAALRSDKHGVMHGRRRSRG
jgi:hypothetical protein